jgi:hypothetical protein
LGGAAVVHRGTDHAQDRDQRDGEDHRDIPLLGRREAGEPSADPADKRRVKHNDPRNPWFCPISRHAIECLVNCTVEVRDIPVERSQSC